MEIIVKNKLFSARDNSFATDESGKEIFQIRGGLGFRRRKSIYDDNNVLCYKLRNKLFAFFKDKVFLFDAKGEKIATLISKRFDFKNKYMLEGYTDKINFSGNLYQFPNIKFQITKNGTVIGQLTKQFNIARDTFKIDVDHKEDAALMVALTIAIDNIQDKKKRKRN